MPQQDTPRFWLLKTIGGPGSLGFLIAGLVVVGLLLLFPRTRRLGRWVLGVLGLGYLILSIPMVAHWIAGPATPLQISAPSTFAGLDDIYVLSGDNYRGRARIAARLAVETKPRFVWAVGGDELKDALIENGVPEALIRLNKTSGRTTYDRITWVAESMRETGSRRAALIVSRLQAPRVFGRARRDKLDVVVMPAPVDNEPPAAGIRAWLPSLQGLALSRDALYERVALAYYRSKGLD